MPAREERLRGRRELRSFLLGEVGQRAPLSLPLSALADEVLEVGSGIGTGQSLRLDQLGEVALERVADAFDDRHGSARFADLADHGTDLLAGQLVHRLVPK